MTHGPLELAELLDFAVYDAETGRLLRKRSTKFRSIGETAESKGLHYGYKFLMLPSKKRVVSHRAAWAIVHGAWPTGEIDHINGCRIDNRLANLRDVSHEVNQQNRRDANANSKSQLLGVYPDGSRWVARICAGRKRISLGSFGTTAEAQAAYLAAKAKVHSGYVTPKYS